MPSLYQKAGIFFLDRPMSYEYDRLAIDLGCSALRFLAGTEGMFPRPGTYDWGAMSGYFAQARELNKRGLNQFLFTALNPPGWAKTNGVPENGGNLLDAQYDAYATFLAQLCKTFKDSTGFELYALSAQNEPMFAEPYGSCVFSDANLSRLNDLIAGKLKAMGINTRLIGPEDVFSNQGLTWNAMKNNANVYAYAGHSPVNWASAMGFISGTGKKLWMSEQDIFPSEWTAGMQPNDYMSPAGNILSALNGGVSWWTWFQYSDNAGAGARGADGVDTMWVPNKHWYATKHFSRFIRPGAVRIGCSAGNAVAFKNPDNSYAVVIVNSGGATTESISGSGLPATWHVYQTTATDNCVYKGQSNGSGISIPASSVVTISSVQAPVLAADTIPYRVAAATPDMTVGQINGFGDDILQVWVNGTQVSTSGSNIVKRMVSLVKGENVVACYVRNTAWGGGLLASMMLPGGDTLHTDGTWKVTYKDPTANAAWNTVSFDDSKWNNAKDVGPVTIWPGFARWGSAAVNLYYQNAHWILGGDHTYFRKVITFSTAGSGVYVRGNNFTYKIYVDGNLIKQGSEFAKCTDGCFKVATATASISLPAGTTHCIGLDITDASTDGNGVLLKAGYTRTGAAAVPMDTTWWCSDSASSGWSTTSFSDTGNWTHPNVIDAYDAGGGVGKFIYPGNFWFRKKFTSKEATRIAAFIQKLVDADRVISVKYFTLQGREVRGDLRQLSALRTALIERRVYRSGRTEEVKFMRPSRLGS